MSKEIWTKVIGNKLWDIDISKEVDFYTSADEKKLKIHIKSPQANMQDNEAAFEAWALIFHCKEGCDVVLSFNELDWDNNIVISSSEQAHYMRFLYRVWKFSEQMKPWFDIDEDKQSIVNVFKTQFSTLIDNNNIINNIPESEAKISQVDNSKLNKLEHFVENTFVRIDEARNMLAEIVKKKDGTVLKNLHNQLPNGLFRGCCQNDISKANRIFPTGFVDLWGISENNELCIFELKVAESEVDNRAVGIVSELFFYANYCKDIFMGKNYSRSTTKFRGYDKIMEAVGKNDGITKIKAYFLSPKYHTRIEEYITNIKNSLNDNVTEIEYVFLNYDFKKIKPALEELKSM